ncbi:MAG: McrB family protein [Vogesella sp.]|uniref:McrB family protein n=1 Tax=Vogesella sp. TaxID=1904252 RepID=UPI00391996BF
MSKTVAEREEILADFVKAWPVSKIESLTLDQYIKVDDKSTLAYWLEFGLGRFLGSIKGGDSSKFGIYERKAEPKGSRSFIGYDERYSWKKKYGDSAVSAFSKIKECMLHTIRAAQCGELDAVESIDFEPALKWKLAFLYQNHQQPCVLPIYQLKMLKKLGSDKPYATHSDAYRDLMSRRGQEPVLQYGERLWSNVPEAEDGNILDDERDEPLASADSSGASLMRHALNQILYGPPGTGKTYETIYAALQILDPAAAAAYKQVDGDKAASSAQRLAAREKLKQRFDELSAEQRVRFVTFHQSFSYEDFVEGLRAETDETSGQLRYDVSDGVFKILCRDAKSKAELVSVFDQAIERLQEKLDAANGRLSLKTVRGKAFEVAYEGGKTFRVFPNSTEVDDPYYVASMDNVRKLFAGEAKKGMYNPSYVEGMLRYLQAECGLPAKPEVTESSAEVKPYVLIIDEINRGNISRIFGELITLIEPSKRAGADEALSVTLPYSKETFSVPANVYIIGTMNTADRSLAGLDLALRRRFSFTEMPPQPELLDQVAVEGVNIGQMLRVMNQRITVLLDRDHTIGHAYFMPLQTEPTLDMLADIFRQKILPLLQEYFFEDWERIRWVLNDQTKPDSVAFIIEDKSLDVSGLFAGVADKLRQSSQWVLNDQAFDQADAYRGIAAKLGKGEE